MTAINVEIYGADELVERLRSVADRADNGMRRPFDEIADDVERRFAQAFSGSPDLVRTGALRASLTATRKGSVRRVSFNSMMRGTSIWYANFSQDRLMQAIDRPDVTRAWLDAINDWLERGEVSGVGI